MKHIGRFLDQKELWTFRISWAVLVICLVFLGARFYLGHLVVTPGYGGSYSEGLIGAPKYINPLYASASDVDSDVTNLVFSSLFKHGSRGELIKDLVTEYSVSPDSKTYTFKIRKDAKWQNGNPVTVDDVVFTFNAIQDQSYNSTLLSSFNGVAIEKIDDDTFKFTLEDSYAPFLELLTFGILPQDTWLQVQPSTASLAELNLKPIGSGPFKYSSLTKDKNGNVKTYTLEANQDYYGNAPLIAKITFKFYPSFEEAIAALNKGEIKGLGYLPPEFKQELISPQSWNLHELNLPQLTAIFFNSKSNPDLADKKIRQALALAINKNDLISQVLGGGVRSVDGPILPDNFAANHNVKKYKYDTASSSQLLASDGWQIKQITQAMIDEAQMNASSTDEKVRVRAEETMAMGLGKWLEKKNAPGDYLVIKFSYTDTKENESIAKFIEQNWSALGVKVVLDPQSASGIQESIIRPRNFEALLYGQVLGADPDVYAFWHSSQSGDRGLNITDFSNKEVDALLEDARNTTSEKDRKAKYGRFQEIVAEEVPAVFLFSPTYIYVQTKDIKGYEAKNIILPRDRFAGIDSWYINTEKKLVW